VLEISGKFACCPVRHYFWREEYDYHRNPGRRTFAIFGMVDRQREAASNAALTKPTRINF
jgi:hypothetical protein